MQSRGHSRMAIVGIRLRCWTDCGGGGDSGRGSAVVDIHGAVAGNTPAFVVVAGAGCDVANADGKAVGPIEAAAGFVGSAAWNPCPKTLILASRPALKVPQSWVYPAWKLLSMPSSHSSAKLMVLQMKSSIVLMVESNPDTCLFHGLLKDSKGDRDSRAHQDLTAVNTLHLLLH